MLKFLPVFIFCLAAGLLAHSAITPDQLIPSAAHPIQQPVNNAVAETEIVSGASSSGCGCGCGSGSESSS